MLQFSARKVWNPTVLYLLITKCQTDAGRENNIMHWLHVEIKMNKNTWCENVKPTSEVG